MNDTQNLAARSMFSLHIDFDSTLFDTKRFANDLWRVIAAQANLEPARVKFDAARHEIDPDLRGYDFAGHVVSYGLDLSDMWKRLDHIVRGTNYLYEDSVAFIKALQSDGFDPKILTFGETQFQKAKIVANLSRLAGEGSTALHAPHHLAYEIVSYKKNEYIASAYPGQKGALVDDVPNQNLPEGFTEIHLDRHLMLLKPEVKPDGFIVSDLAQARTIIRSLAV